MVGGSEAAVSEPEPFESGIIRVSGLVKRRLEELRLQRCRDLGRKSVTMSEVIEQLLADQWSPRP